jgi:hypothetical protein
MKTGKALLIVMMDVDPSIEHEFNQWQDDEHVPERLSCPGFVSARRFRSVAVPNIGLTDVPRYMTVYELEGAEALMTETYLDFRFGSTRTALSNLLTPRLQNFVRGVFVEISRMEKASNREADAM